MLKQQWALSVISGHRGQSLAHSLRMSYLERMPPAPLVIALVFAAGAVAAACLLAKRVGLVVPFAFIAAYVVAVGAITFVNIGVFDMADPKFRNAWVESWLALYWPLWTALFAPAAISALLSCWFSRPLTREDAMALLGVCLLLILVAIEVGWALDRYAGFWFLVGEFALLTAIFFGMACVKRAVRGEIRPLGFA
jgi:hypothetical protein